MARRKRSKGEKPDGEQTTIPSRGRPAPDEVRVFPFELRSGDRWTYPEGREREVTGRPTAYKQGKMTSVRLQKPGEPSVIDVQYLDAHERIRVRRP
jgi:hypothetical protein